MRVLVFIVSLILLFSCNVDLNKSSSSIDYNLLEFKDEVGYYNGKPYTGKVVVYFENGEKRFETDYLEGIDHGVFKEWDEEGNLLETSRLVNGKLEGRFTRFYPNGQQHFQGTYKSGKIDGEAKEWYPSGQLKLELSYQVGQEHGDYTFYDEDGKQILKGRMEKGERDGIWYEYNELNGKTYKNQYDNGVLIESVIHSN